MTTTVLPCPTCRLPVRLREGERTVQCTGCGSIVRAGGGSHVSGYLPAYLKRLRETGRAHWAEKLGKKYPV